MLGAICSAQLAALVWKNWLLRRRSWGSVIVEIAFPLIFCCLVVMLHTQGEVTNEPPKTYFTFTLSGMNMNVLYKPQSRGIDEMLKSGTESLGVNFTYSKDLTESENQRLAYVEFFFDNPDEVPKKLNFRGITKAAYSTNEVFGERYEHYASGINYAQYIVTKAFLHYWHKKIFPGKPLPKETIEMLLMPLPARTVTPRNATIEILLSIYNLLFIGLAAFTTKFLVQEKECKLKETMKLMGLSTFSYWLSWFISSFVIGAIVCLIFIVTFSFDWYANGKILNSNPALNGFFMLCYVTQIITFAFLVSCFLKSGKNAAIIGGTLFFAMSLLAPLSFDYLKNRILSHIVAMVLFPSAACYYKLMLSKKETAGKGIWFLELSNHEVVPHLNLIDVLIMFLTNTLFNVFMIWYIDNINPGEYGIPQPLNFFMTKQYWCPSPESAEDIPEMPPQDQLFFESPPSKMTVGIQIRHLMKVFKGHVAVADTNLDLYQDQITVLLGHNGAGKTTTINMITGFIKPTRGTVIVHGYDIIKNLHQARESLGLCPQHDILFSSLTCIEHLIFYTKLKKKYNEKTSMAEFTELLADVDLATKHKAYPTMLSGGQRRKLSVLCAFVGGNKTIFLDEPSSSLDPSARRDLWTFLKNRRAGKTILLTTHYMDEADMLGDRIVIMAEGVVKCYGTPNFLKRLYGTGYHLIIVKQPGCVSSKITKSIKEHVSTAFCLSETNTEITYSLPDDKTAFYAAMLLELEMGKDKYAISSMGLVSTSMEDVFLRVGEGFKPRSVEGTVDVDPKTIVTGANNSSKDFQREPTSLGEGNVSSPPLSVNISNQEASSIPSTHQAFRQQQSNNNNMLQVEQSELFKQMSDYIQLHSLPLFLHQVIAIFIKRALEFFRSKISSITMILLPLVLTSLGIRADIQTTNIKLSEPLYFTLDRFPTDLVFPLFTTKDSPSKISDMFRSYVKSCGTVKDIKIDLQQVRKDFEKKTNQTDKLDIVTAISMSANDELIKIIDEVGEETYITKYLIGLYHMEPPFSSITSLYQNGPIHVEGITVQLMMNAWVQGYLGSEYSVETGIQHEMTEGEKRMNKAQIMTVLALGFAMALVPAFFIHTLIKERVIGARHLQALSGVNPFAYWLGNFLFDFFIYLIIVGGLMCAFLTNPGIYIDGNRWQLTLLLLLEYGVSIFPYLYAVQFLFKNPSNGVAAMLMFSIFIGVGAGIVLGTLRRLDKNFKGGPYYVHILFLCICPNYPLTSTLFAFVDLTIIYELKGITSDTLSNYLKFTSGEFVMSESYFTLLYIALAAWVFIVAFDFQVFRILGYIICPSLNSLFKDKKINTTGFDKVDDDVVNEKQMISKTPLHELLKKYQILMVDLSKKYFIRGKLMTAVHSTSLGVQGNECLGLLGQNGAGKSTTFKMLTGDVSVTSGNAYLNGMSIKSKMKKIQTMMGYCPQYDALNDTLTGRETLYLYARLRGVPSHALKRVSQAVIDFVMLAPHEDKYTMHYSGGNKRKLSVGISIIGNPKFVMLDEPTAGMDPVARRTQWTVLGMIRASGRTLVLTSHSMEECEALCTRLAIMVLGRVLCLGSSQHLKSKYGKGYTVILHAAIDKEDKTVPLDSAENYLLETFKKSEIFVKHEAYSDIRVPETYSASHIFDILEKAKSKFNFQHYTVEQTSLEQVFLRFMNADDV